MSTPTRLDPVITPTATFNALDFMAGDGSDETEGMRALFAARNAVAGDAAVYFPAPSDSYHVVSDDPNGLRPAVVDSVRSGTDIYGDGSASIIRWTGVVKASDSAGHSSSLQKLFRMDSVSRVRFRDFRIEGDNDPVVSYLSTAAAMVFSSGGSPQASTDCIVRDVEFANLVGQPALARGSGDRRVHFIRNTLEGCGPGLHLSADHSVHYRNRITDCPGGFGCTAIPVVIALNDLVRAATLVGGYIQENRFRPGTVCVGNSLDESPPNVALLTGQSYTDGWLQGNVIEDAESDAIVIGGLGSSPNEIGNYRYDRCTIANNVVVSSNRALGIQRGPGHTVIDNQLAADLLSGFTLSGDTNPGGHRFVGNTLAGTWFQGTAGDADLWVDNTFTSGHLSVSPVATPLITEPAPSGVEVKGFGDVREGLATIQVINWDSDDSVPVDLGALNDGAGVGLVAGDPYELYHPYDLLGTPVLSGTYDPGSSIVIPMTSVDPPQDWAVSTSEPLPSLGPRANAFVLFRTQGATVSDCMSPDPS